MKNVDIEIPKNKLVVITGVSGSGKSSLAFDTIYAEGQRRYVESLSTYARQFLEMNNKPDIESIEGLSPAIAIDQKTTCRNPRSTVATATEIYDYLRVLFARIGVPYSPATGLPIKKQSATQMVDIIMNLPKETGIILLAPIVRGQKGEHKKDLLHYRRLGYEKLKINGIYYDFEDIPHIDKNKNHDIELVIDRLKLDDNSRERIVDSVENILKISKGLLYLEIKSIPKDLKSNNIEEGQIMIFSEKFSCPVSGFSLLEIEPRIFSFNSPYGACKKCNGLGKEMSFDEKLIIPNKTLSLSEGAIAPWRKKGVKYSNTQYKFYDNLLNALALHYDFDLDTPYEELPKSIRKIILNGSGDENIKFSYQDVYKQSTIDQPFKGVIAMLEEKLRKRSL